MPSAGAEIVTTNWVAVAEVTVPASPRLKTTVLLAGVVEKPEPLMVMVALLSAISVLLKVTTGMTL